MLTWHSSQHRNTNCCHIGNTKNIPGLISSIIICTLLLPPLAQLTFECVANDVFLVAWSIGNELMVTLYCFKCAWCSKLQLEKFSVTNNLIRPLLSFWSSYIVLTPFMKVFQKTVHSNCVTNLVVIYACIRFIGKLTTSIYIIYHIKVYCCLWIIPMESLGSILDWEWIVLHKI